MKRYRLAIIQSHATQFDAPLYCRISKRSKIDLAVYYTKPGQETPFDAEIGRKAVWDHLAGSGYRCEIRKQGFRNTFRFLKRIRNGWYDLVVISGYSSCYYLLAAVYLRLKGVPVGLRSDTTLEATRSYAKSLFKRLVMPWIMKLYSTGHPTGALAGEYLARYGLAKNRQFRFPYAVDNDYLNGRCRRYRTRRKRLRRFFGIGPDSFVVLGVLKLAEREDPMTLLLGFVRFLESCPEAHLLLVGDGPLKRSIENVIEEKRILNVHLPGYVPYSRLALFYGISDVFVHPPLRESWGVSVNEAMACGLPVVVADTVGSRADLVKPGKTGFVFERSNPQALATRLVELSRNPDSRRLMGKRAQELIADWNYDGTEKSLVDALEAIAQERRLR